MGGAAGPVVMGYAIDMAGFPSIGWVLIVLVIVGTPLLSLGLIEADRIKAYKIYLIEILLKMMWNEFMNWRSSCHV